MNTPRNASLPILSSLDAPTRGPSARLALLDADLAAAARRAIDRAAEYLLAQQSDEGFWCGELQGDTILESEYILLLAWLGQEQSPVARKAAVYILRQQLPEGGWAQYPGGPVDVSGSVKAYFALKLTGHDPQAESMRRARRAIIAHGGADAVNSFTRFYLALLGQISYDHCPAVPPEALLLPAWLPVSIYRISAWSRTILVPLSIMWAYRPSRPLPPERGIRELCIRQPDYWPPPRCPGLETSKGLLTWDRFFRGVDRALKCCQPWPLQPFRRLALKAAETWMTERFAGSDGLGAIFPPIIWSVVALKCLGYRDDSPEVTYCRDQLRALVIQQDGAVRLQPCKSPVWDTAITLRALASAGLPPHHPATYRAACWLLSKEVRRRGDWAKTVKADPGGWFFEHRNEFYPDIDDTAMVMIALHGQLDERAGDGQDGAGGKGEQRRSALAEAARTIDEGMLVAQQKAGGVGEARRMIRRLCWPSGPPDRSSAYASRWRSPIAGACERARRWLLAMQNRDGGWGAFDKDNDYQFLCHVPFADHNAMIDPSTPDVTGRVLESLACWGMAGGDAPVDRAVGYLRRAQEPDGSWFGRWGVNYIYGTWQVLVGLSAAGLSPRDPAVRRGADWLLAHQQSSGAWGESADSYVLPSLRGQGPATASQTAWALLGLIAAGRRDHRAVETGIRFLVETQQDDGSWEEEQFTGTGFPRVFYLRYHLYPVYFPLLALARWVNPEAANQIPERADLGRRLAVAGFGQDRAQKKTTGLR